MSLEAFPNGVSDGLTDEQNKWIICGVASLLKRRGGGKGKCKNILM